nr:hypothetical protein Q903MT_gene1516 [Picea sitchensis]
MSHAQLTNSLVHSCLIFTNPIRKVRPPKLHPHVTPSRFHFQSYIVPTLPVQEALSLCSK